ncbi:hypothetical protein HYS96_00085 [Candidatus Daviesbacteria bacterium]|nr:hypothetical protein [Candidatus Daviesbacteria bacterium]
MNNFKLTSMFIGILLDKSVFSNLFVQLNSYLRENNLQDHIVLQNINSIHLTLYYLDSRLLKEEKEKIQLFVDRLRKDLQNLKLNITSFNYFYDQGKQSLCYFECNNERLIKVNKILKLNFPNSVLENTYSFVPHITLFKIKDYSFFKKHKKNLEKILIAFSKRMGSRNIFKSVNIFKVDSTKEPELQIPS